MKKIILMLQMVVLITFSAFQTANAADAVYTSYFSSKAVSGYDVVSYFTESKPVKGSSKYTFEYQGADWYFSSAENLALFKTNPVKYAPQYGGHCAWALSNDQIAPGNAPFWTVYNDKLYLNYDKSVMDTWVTDKDAFIKQADSWTWVITKWSFIILTLFKAAFIVLSYFNIYRSLSVPYMTVSGLCAIKLTFFYLLK